MKKNIFMLITIFLLLFISSISFGEEQIEVFYNDEKIDFATDPILKDNTLMVPMRQFFESFDAHVNWISNTKEVLAYKGNTFIKLKINDSTCYTNGKKNTLKSPPIIINNRTLVPVEFVAKTFDMNLKWNDTKTILHINNKYRDNIYSYLGTTFFKKYYLKNEGIEFSLPNSWIPTNSNQYSFNLYDNLQNYTLSISSGFLNDITLNEYISNIQSDIERNNPNKIIFSEIKNSEINDILFKIIHLNNNYQTENEKQKKNILYFFQYDNKVHLFNFSYTDTIQDEDAINLTNIIINSLKISTLTINRNNEHYIEFKKFFELNINLNNELFANKDISNSFEFSGSINNENIKLLKAIVEKNNNRKIFDIPIKENQFNQKIYTPFGLGKHNVTIIASDEVNKNYNNQSIITMNKPDSSVVMQFSIVNLDSENILYLLPNDYVLSTNENLLSAAKLITIDQNNSYDKSKILYEWLFNNVSIAEENIESIEIKNALDVFNDSSGTNIEINFLYCSFLRSLNIPSKIIKRLDIDNNIFYQTEIFLNGKWITTDINTEIISSANNKYLNYDFFNIYDQNYFDKFIFNNRESKETLKY
jgi:hypothetical protein